MNDTSDTAMDIKVDKTLNLPTLATMVFFVFGLGAWNATLQASIAKNASDVADLQATRKERVTLADKKYADLDATTYRLGIVEGNVNAINNRLDNSFNRLGERLDRLTEIQNKGFAEAATELATIKTNIAVLQQRVDALGAQKRADLSLTLPRLILPASR